GERQDQKERRKTDHDLDQAADQVVDPTAEVTRERAEHDADRHIEGHRDDADGERDPRAVEHAREYVAALRVRAEPVLRVGCDQALRRVRLAIAIPPEWEDRCVGFARLRELFGLQTVVLDGGREVEGVIEGAEALRREKTKERERAERKSA